jgi:hypothetical protein
VARVRTLTSRRACAGAVVLLAALLAGAPIAGGAATKLRSLSAAGQLVRTKKTGDLSAIQQGTLRGAPFGSGRMVLASTLKQARVNSTFTVTTSAGRVSGRASARVTVDGDTSSYKGTATLTGGTGRYRRITGRNITFTGKGPVSAKQVRITLVGKVRY